jgi:hypothetical protein
LGGWGSRGDEVVVASLGDSSVVVARESYGLYALVDADWRLVFSCYDAKRVVSTARRGLCHP